MDSIRNMAGSVGNWVKSNITGDEGVSRDYKPNDSGLKDITDSYDRIEDRVDKVGKDLDKIGEKAELRPPRLSDFSDKDLVVVGAAGGAAIGGALGMADGVLQTALDEAKINVTETKHDIQKPVLKGFDGKLAEDKDSAGSLQGYNHTFSPRIEYQKVGTFETKEAQVTHSVNAESPVSEGIKNMVAGAAIGGGLGVALAVGRKIMKKGQFEGRQDRPIEGEGKVIAAGAGLGAAGGAVLGGLGAMIEAGHGEGKEISWKQPIMEKMTLGQMPQDHYHSVFEVVKETNVPNRDVVLEGPKMEKGLLGIGESPAMEKITKTVEVAPRYGIMSQVLGGTILGAVGGALAGVVVNVLRKIV
ncbi:MAG: hypothetical protein LWY06_04040 [Firmicutes bacterium]|nr:hypothetical protein [Bacillota bacterium]